MHGISIVTAKGAYGNVTEELFVLTFVALQPCSLRGQGLLQHLWPLAYHFLLFSVTNSSR